jgi:hypothetical protein
MKVKTASGVSITFIQEGSSKIILFDRPVRGIELKEQEIARIDSFLTSMSVAASASDVHDSDHFAQKEKRGRP